MWRSLTQKPSTNPKMDYIHICRFEHNSVLLLNKSEATVKAGGGQTREKHFLLILNDEVVQTIGRLN